MSQGEKGAAYTALLALVACSGCAFSLPDYHTVSTRHTEGRTIILSLVNPTAELLWDPPTGDVKTYPYGTDPPLGDYVASAMRSEFAAAGMTLILTEPPLGIASAALLMRLSIRFSSCPLSR